MESTLVIKVKYGDTLRRFNANVDENGQLDLNMTGLRAKILGLFNFPLDTDLTLTYVDEDGDVVTLVEDDDLLDVMRQRLKFLRIDVERKSDQFGKTYAKSSGSSTPIRSPQGHNPFPNINNSLADLMKSVPEPLRDIFSKLSLDLATKLGGSNCGPAELVECFSKMGQSILNPTLQPQVGACSSTPTTDTKNLAFSAGTTVPNVAKYETSHDVRIENVSRGVNVPIKPVPAPIDLNLEPSCDSNPSGCVTVNFSPPPIYWRKETKEENDGHLREKSVNIGVSSSSTDSARPVGNECPFSGMPVVNDSSVRPSIPSHIYSFRRNRGRNDAVVGMFHRGVQCDGCGVHPITGPRYKSKVKGDYDLCSICFAEMGNEADYIKMDRPVSYRLPRPFKGLHDPNYWVNPSPVTPLMRHCGIKQARPKLDSRFILDVNVLDGTVMAPSTSFTKIWRMRNVGSLVWPQGARLMWIGGDRFSYSDSVDLEIPVDGIPMDGELDIAVDFTSPELPGRYISYWKMASPTGTKFGQRVWVLIQVDASMLDSVCDGVHGLNLNMPPGYNGSKSSQTIDVNVLPAMDSGFLEPHDSTSVSVPVKPMDDVELPRKVQQLNFPINDILLVGDGVSTPVPPQVSSSVSYPIIDLSDAAPVGSSEVLPAIDVSTSSEHVKEESLLKELEEMGFKQVDLNKEILREKKYNLEESVDALCGVSEWDLILDELQLMGFCDKAMNKKLLEKNNGSIKHVVMDLISGEKA